MPVQIDFSPRTYFIDNTDGRYKGAAYQKESNSPGVPENIPPEPILANSTKSKQDEWVRAQNNNMTF